jgi:hypothetical protein
MKKPTVKLIRIKQGLTLGRFVFSLPFIHISGEHGAIGGVLRST